MEKGEQEKAKRCFFAVPIPGEAKRKIFSAYSSAIPPREFRVVREENLHITVFFFGSIPPGEELALLRKAESVRLSVFRVCACGFGSFQKRVVFAEVVEGKEELGALFKQVKGIAGSVPENGFLPHITLARARASRSPTGIIPGCWAEEVCFEARELAFFESVHSPEKQGPEYKKIKAFPFSEQG